ncbi:zinc finger BED domain-containing protein RICESLEEPER 2-like [Apium graveolens]|uniref:zinc finger BED domain-containing protein RICESLEEPER 2-like n=1 Tax=Apium graveolens TaxID=4045 RepID=UPI003D7A42DA
MAEKMLLKFEKYWDVIHGVVGVSTVLDPRYKLEVLQFYFDKIFGACALAEVEKVRDLCFSLLREYHQKLNSSIEGNDESGTLSKIASTENASQYDLFISTKKRKKVDFIKSEFEHYLDEDVWTKAEGFDVLSWWKLNAPKYPTLACMARDFLAVPASTVASESAFSSSGRLVSPHRNRLHPTTIEALMCAQSW